MALQDQTVAVFSAGGVLAGATEHFQPRPGQTEMALAVARTIESGGALVVEAGTGVGKTFSYLVPALLSGERVLLSTATKTLQDQLFGRDLPRLIEALGLPVRPALLKGRGSYLCLHRMEQARVGALLPDRASVRTLGRIEDWARTTRTGDLAELPGLDERSPLIPLVTSSRDNCLGSDCPKARACHVNLARREAMAADIVVINHHLFFADLAVRESGMAELLPSVRVAIFDEAHQLNETGIQFLGRQFTTGQVLDFARDLLAVGLQGARGAADWSALAAQLDRAARDLRLQAGNAVSGSKLRWTGDAPERTDVSGWCSALEHLATCLGEAGEVLGALTDLGPDFVRLAGRGAELGDRASAFLEPSEPGSARWVDVGQQLRLVESPLDIAQTVRSRLLRAEEPSASEAARAWIFTSATLGDDAGLSWFTEPCGLADAEILKVDSPFDYPAQAGLWLPSGLPLPNAADHSERVASLAGDAALRLNGRTMVLTTTLRALRTIGAALQARLGAAGTLDILVQGDGPKRRLIERFREGDSVAGRGCVLVASASFWEGVDVPGDSLQLVVIDKLPFPPPGDPLVEARSQRLQAEGRSPFNDYFLPEAAVALKQGAGRLIRRESDRGVLMLCDPRMSSMAYGRRLLAALPPMRRLRSQEEFAAMLDELAATRASTSSVHWT